MEDKRDLSKTAEDGDGNVDKTIRLITQDKNARECEIKLIFVPSCSQMRLQLLHFHAIFKTWPTFLELRPIVFFIRTALESTEFYQNTYRVTKVKICSVKYVKYENYEEIFFLPPDVGVVVLVCLRSLKWRPRRPL